MEILIAKIFPVLIQPIQSIHQIKHGNVMLISVNPKLTDYLIVDKINGSRATKLP
jgi:hypothetical protein